MRFYENMVCLKIETMFLQLLIQKFLIERFNKNFGQYETYTDETVLTHIHFNQLFFLFNFHGYKTYIYSVFKIMPSSNSTFSI